MNSTDYFSYLSQRSWRAVLYRKYVLYPFLKRTIKGQILDIGCGIGDFLNFCSCTIGVDVNQDNVNYCKSKKLNAVWLSGDEFPFLDASFDSVLIDNVIEHVQNPTKILIEANRLLHDGGQMMVGVPGLKGYAADDDHKVYYTEDLLKSVCSRHGFVFIKTYYMPLFKSEFLSRNLKQYCLYCLFIKSSIVKSDDSI